MHVWWARARFINIHSYLKQHYGLKKGTTGRHLEGLRKREYILKASRGVYRITEFGKKYLELLEDRAERYRAMERKAKRRKALFSPPFKEFKILMIRGEIGKRINIRSFLEDLGWTEKEDIKKIEQKQLETLEGFNRVWFETDREYLFNFFDPLGFLLQFTFGKNGEFECISSMVEPNKEGILDEEMKSGSINPIRYLIAYVSPYLMMIDGYAKKHAMQKGLIIKSVAYSGSVERNYYIKEEEKSWTRYLNDFISLNKGFKRVPKTPLKSSRS